MSDRAKGGARNKRQLKNFLLDRKFQLKYASILVCIAAVLSVVLGLVLWRTSQSLVAQSHGAVKHGQKAVTLGQEVAAESRKVSAVVEMNIVNDPFYADNPELLDAFKTDSAQKQAKLTAQQEALQVQATALNQQSAQIETQQRRILTSLFVVLGLLVVCLGLAGIVVTHKVAGPVFKMTRQIKTLGSGNWRVPDPLRKGDELVEFHGAFATMVKQLRELREGELEQLDAILEEKADGEERDKLVELRAGMAKVLDG